MKKIDAHSHIGTFGGWAGVAFTKEKLIEQMNEYDIEKISFSLLYSSVTFPIMKQTV